MLLVVDNYDSFTYNLVQYLGELGANPRVFRNDRITLEEIKSRAPSAVVISPGPGIPSEAGLTLDIIKEFAGQIPILGVCLGHQAIGEALGGRVVRAPAPMHGKVSLIHHDGEGIFRGIECPFPAVRYHSLMLCQESLPGELEVSARSGDGLIMAVSHREYPLTGLQFHPESIMTKAGKRIMANFLREVEMHVEKIYPKGC